MSPLRRLPSSTSNSNCDTSILRGRPGFGCLQPAKGHTLMSQFPAGEQHTHHTLSGIATQWAYLTLIEAVDQTPPGIKHITDLQATELVIINSSRPKAGLLPDPRVIKRRNNHYMLPQSPESPSPGSIGSATRGHCTSGRGHNQSLQFKFSHVDSK